MTPWTVGYVNRAGTFIVMSRHETEAQAQDMADWYRLIRRDVQVREIPEDKEGGK